VCVFCAVKKATALRDSLIVNYPASCRYFIVTGSQSLSIEVKPEKR